MFWGILGGLCLLVAGFIAGRLTKHDPEVIAEYQERETFEHYARKAMKVLETLEGKDDLMELIIQLDGIAILSAYNRKKALQFLPETNYKYNEMTQVYGGAGTVWEDLRDARRIAMVAVRNLYGRKEYEASQHP